MRLLPTAFNTYAHHAVVRPGLEQPVVMKLSDALAGLAASGELGRLRAKYVVGPS